MAYFEQAACLATAWANDDEISTLGANLGACLLHVHAWGAMAV